MALLSVSMDNIMSFKIDVGVLINDLITSGEKGAEYSVLIKELHDSHVGRAFNGTTICIYHEQKTSA